MQITKLSRIDAEVVATFERLIHQLNPTSEKPKQEDLEEILQSDTTLIFIGKVAEKIVGTISLVFYKIPTGKKAWIEDVIVDEEYRGKGFGKQLMEHAIAYAQQDGVRKISLTSNPARIAANKMYQNLGFEQYITNMYRLNVD